MAAACGVGIKKILVMWVLSSPIMKSLISEIAKRETKRLRKEMRYDREVLKEAFEKAI